MKDETNPKDSPVGLYKDPESGKYIGALDENQASAIIKLGFKLVEAGIDAAKKTDAQIEAESEAVTQPKKEGK